MNLGSRAQFSGDEDERECGSFVRIFESSMLGDENIAKATN